MSTKENENMRGQAFKTLHELHAVLYPMILIEHSLSENVRHQIQSPIGKMDWPEKDKYARELITILKTAKNEQEILERANEALKSINP